MKKQYKDHLQNLALEILRWSGFLFLWRYLHRYDVVIVILHGVMDSEEQTKWIPLRGQTPRKVLDDTLRILSKHYRFISLQDAADGLAGRKPIDPYSLVLTFDDGYRNNMKYALPILRRYGAPATFFIATGHVENRKPFWWDRLDYALQNTVLEGRSVRIAEEIVHLHSDNRGILTNSYKQLRDKAKSLNRCRYEIECEMERRMEGIAAELETESVQKLEDIFECDDWSAILSWEDIENIIGNDVIIGSHTVNHIQLGHAEGDIIRDQLVRSKEMIEAHIGGSCRFLCYPYGSFNQQAIDIARECGYGAAVTCESGVNKFGDDLMALKRINFPSYGIPARILADVSGLVAFISLMRSCVRKSLFMGKRKENDHKKNS